MAARTKANRKLIAFGAIIILAITVFFIVLMYMAKDAFQTNLIAIEEEIIKKYDQEYQTILYNFNQLADNYYDEIIDDENIMEIMYEAKGTSETEQQELRKKLEVYSSDINKNALDDNLDGLHFLLDHDKSFLNLTNKPFYENKIKLENANIPTTEHNSPYGIIYQHALKYKGESVGYVELSVSYSTITKLMSSLYNIESAFIIEKQAVDTIISNNQVSKNHISVPFTDEFYLDKYSFSIPKDFAVYPENVFEELIVEDFNWGDINLLALDESFFITISYEDIDYSVVFLWVDNIANNNDGYFIFIDEDTYYYTLRASAISQYVALLLMWLLTTIIIIILLFNRSKIEKISYFDNLTRAYNRNKLFDMIESEMDKDNKKSTNLSLLLIDIDKFKDVNDTYGHLVGDKVLQKIAKLLFQAVRATDMVFRYGGDEFIILLPNTRLTDAERVASKINKAVNNIIWEELNTPVTLSIGVAQYKQSESIDQLINRSDSVLYKAKELGRNRVVCDS